MRCIVAGIGCAAIVGLLWTGDPARAQQSPGGFQGSIDDPGINYSSAKPANPVEILNRRLAAGTAHLVFDSRSGYLRSVLRAMEIPLDSQLLVFSDRSLQGNRIGETNPRAIFFKDDLQMGWVRGADLIEVATQDPTLGTVFYTLQQDKVPAPRFRRAMVCLGCHRTPGTFGVPGLVAFSSLRLSGGAFLHNSYMNDSTPIAERFGGWFVTGAVLPPDHRGNNVVALQGRSHALQSTEGLYSADGYASNTSDIAALMVFAHQVRTVNLMTRAGWEARAAAAAFHRNAPAGADALTPRVHAAVRDLVDSLLFVDEARFNSPTRGSSGFAERFATEGPRDRKGRSLRQLDLTRRLMRYPCSYLIYSAMFDALPPSVRALVYERMWEILSGAEKEVRYRTALPLTDRQAITEILRDTKYGLPSYFTRVLQPR